MSIGNAPVALGNPLTTLSSVAFSGEQTRLLFLTSGLDAAGLELRLLDFARGFPESAEMHVCVLSTHASLRDEFEKTRAKVMVLPIARPYLEWGRIRRVLAYIGTHDLRVINSFDVKSLIVGVIAKLRYGSRIRLVHHIVGLWRDLGPRHKAAMWRLLDFVDAVVCNGEAVRREVLGVRRLKARVATIPNGVDCVHFRNSALMRDKSRARLGYSAETFVLGTVANAHPFKNYPFLIRCMRRLTSEHAHLRLLCVGGGKYLDEVKQLVRTLDIEDRVTFTGAVLDVREHLAAMDAYALCSITEGCPNSLMQAMAMSVPVVASTVGEVPYLVVDGESGLLFSLPDEEGFCDAVSRLMADQQDRSHLAAAGRARMEHTYSIDRMIDQYLALFQTLAAEAR